MKNDAPVIDFAESGAKLYPHLKVTAERFPRVLATRRIDDDDALYFGAFLSRTSVRILLDFLTRTFRLRNCDIAIDGSFAVPCTQFYRRRCLGPCVSDLCSEAEYADRVRLVTLFLANDRGGLSAELKRRIAAASEEFLFEQAAEWRDILLAVEDWWSKPRLDVWLDDCVDTFAADESEAGQYVYLVTTRNRNVLGRKAFHVSKGGAMSNDEAIREIVSSFYRFHVPREIRVSHDFEGRLELARTLQAKFNRPVKIVVARPDRQMVTAIRALRLAQADTDLDSIKDKADAKTIGVTLKRHFGLSAIARRVEAFDVAHISGEGFVAARSVWKDGRASTEDYYFEVSDASAELAAMADAVRRRILDGSELPDLIVLDGGKPQLNAVRGALSDVLERPPMIGAVKPAGRHEQIGHFLTETGEKIDFIPQNTTHSMLQLLRDDAHDLSNRAHRDVRDMKHHYELAALLPTMTERERLQVIAKAGSMRKLAGSTPSELADLFGSEKAAVIAAQLERSRGDAPDRVIPLVVPLRFVEVGGDADDLRPIESR